MGSTLSSQAGSAVKSAPIRMPFGKHKGKRLSAVPHDYIDWLLGQEIDDRLRLALTQAKGANGTSGSESVEHGVSGKVVYMSQQRTEGLSDVVGEFLEARERAAKAKQHLTDIREQLIPLLQQAGGAHIDEISGQRVSVEERCRWDYDPTLLHRLVADGAINESQFAACLKTVVDKAVVAEWQEQELVSDAQLEHVNARVVTKVLQQIVVKPIG